MVGNTQSTTLAELKIINNPNFVKSKKGNAPFNITERINQQSGLQSESGLPGFKPSMGMNSKSPSGDFGS